MVQPLRGRRSVKGGLLATLVAITSVSAHRSDATPLTFEMPFAAQQTHSDTRIDSYALPTGPFDAGALPTLALEGEVTRMAWQVRGQMTTLQLLAPVREKLSEMGFSPLLQCDTDACGGFDFRFGVDLIEAPDMNVDLFDFRALSAQRGTGDTADHVFLLISRAGSVGYIQLTHVTSFDAAAQPSAPDAIEVPLEPDPESPTDLSDIATGLTQRGQVILGDLIFATGSSNLQEASYTSLNALADFLKTDAARRVVLVGHTDTQGTLAGNVALSKRRAGAVMQRLSSRYSVPPSQMTAEGAGYLAPVASNLTDTGRKANRRVEAVLLSME